ncbi:MAG: hypothetical protein QM774_06690 [Gordonia sp. (in: high G+C Gram-positive bacteria)]|uniref:hypothetical protein n=1 Tax=Gordonia sp. (in: high G+C Gram-positive bacteria) TaxID=84139 RepID=UPI0039E4813C
MTRKKMGSRTRSRGFRFAKHNNAPLTAAELSDAHALIDLVTVDGGDRIDVEHIPARENRAGRPHIHGGFWFKHPRDLVAVEAALPGFKVETMGGRNAWPRYIDYLRREGFYDDELRANFDWRRVVAKLNTGRPPTLNEIKRRVLAGELRPPEIVDRWPEVYLAHQTLIDRAWRISCDANERAASQRMEVAWQARLNARRATSEIDPPPAPRAANADEGLTVRTDLDAIDLVAVEMGIRGSRSARRKGIMAEIGTTDPDELAIWWREDQGGRELADDLPLFAKQVAQIAAGNHVDDYSLVVRVRNCPDLLSPR